MVEQVKIFSSDEIEEEVNKWLSENHDKIAIVSRKLSVCNNHMTIAIFYTAKN